MRDIRSRLESIIGSQFVTSEPERLAEASRDATVISFSPEIVVFPGSLREISEVVRLLYSAGMAITARGAGTGLSGGAVPAEGGAVLDLSRMTRLSLDPGAMTASAEAGVITAEVDKRAAAAGLMYPPDPASLRASTIGGNIATNAGGPGGLKYGVTSDYVLGLTLVGSDGRIVRLGGRTRKKAAGYRLTQLVVGSEGTLGVIADALLRLIPRPEHRATVLAAFTSLEGSAEAVARILQEGFVPAALELMDRSSLEYVMDVLPPQISAAEAILLIEQHGDAPAVAAELSSVLRIAAECGASEVTESLDEAGRDSLWLARRLIGARIQERRPYRISEDPAVPIPAIPEFVRTIREICAEESVSVAVWGHAGDGNLHPSLIFDEFESKTVERVSRAASRIFEAALALGGTVSAEHGLGLIKREFAEAELGSEALDLMQQVKRVFDPKGLFNPGKVFPKGEVVGPPMPRPLRPGRSANHGKA